MLPYQKMSNNFAFIQFKNLALLNGKLTYTYINCTVLFVNE